MPDLTHHPECWRDPKHHACAVREVERLREALGELVRECEGHDRSVAQIIGKPVGWRDAYLDRARRALERVEEGGE